jgi:hypothetical protein
MTRAIERAIGSAAHAAAVLLSASMLFLPAGAPCATLTCKAGDKACIVKMAKEHVTGKIAYWQPAFARPVELRIGAAPPALVERVNLDNMLQDVPNRARTAALPDDLIKDVRDAFAEIPPRIKRLLDGKLAGIYLVEDLGGTGFTDYIVDEQSKPVAGFILLDQSVLARQRANAWSTWKENTPFRPAAGYSLSAVIETPAQDNRKNAIQYILLHEIAHVLSIGANFHPLWAIEPKDVDPAGDFPFFRLSWTVDRKENHYATPFDAEFPGRRDVHYYFGARLSGDRMASTYDLLERTNFPTLYAATRPGDDFAESFVSYVHTVLLGRPFEIRIARGGKVVKVFESCWTQPRCAAKRKLLEDFLAAK